MARRALAEGAGGTVRELIDILKDYPEDLAIELAIVAPVSEEDEGITIDRYSIAGVLPWDDTEDAEGDETQFLWLVGGEDDDVEAFLDTLDDEDEEDDEA